MRVVLPLEGEHEVAVAGVRVDLEDFNDVSGAGADLVSGLDVSGGGELGLWLCVHLFVFLIHKRMGIAIRRSRTARSRRLMIFGRATS